MKTWPRRVLAGAVVLAVALVSALALGGGVSATATRSDSAKPEPGHPFAGLVAISASRKMYLECRGTGSPTVVLVPGLDSAADAWTTSQAKQEPPVLDGVGRFTRVCTYDRPGTVVGDDLTPAPTTPVPQPTTAQDAVTDLHALLRASGEPGPYVLVGHSYGGLITRIYAAEYRHDVAGLVFVDAFAPQWKSAMTPRQWQTTKAITGPTTEQLAQYPEMERIDFDASVAQARLAVPSRSLPVTVLSRDTRNRPMGPSIAAAVAAGKLPAFVPADFGYIIDRAWNKAQDALAKLVPHAKHVVVKDSGHNIQLEYPQAVTTYIRQVFDKAAQQK